MHKKAVLKLAAGFRGRAGNCIRIARERVEKALQYATRDRRSKKRDVRSLWITRINAGAREHGLTYSTFIAGLKADNIALNRKILSDFAEKEPLSFGALAARVRALQEKGKVSAGSGSGS